MDEKFVRKWPGTHTHTHAYILHMEYTDTHLYIPAVYEQSQ